ncbi:LIRP-like isoform X2 [Vespula squamosa]|uniref:LIRP-like isoform X2 n=1 Tax=Vespula squamosa TaxID=30214 RepID=A0ABD1ZU76_VESSQ
MSTYRVCAFVAFVLVVTCFLIEFGNTQYSFQDKRQSQTLHKYCGKNLSNALGLLCDGVYNSMFKKNGQEETNEMYVIALFLEMEMDDYPFAYDESYPFRSAVTANAMMGRFAGTRFRRESRGVYDECCVKPCSIQELTSYCGRVAQ